MAAAYAPVTPADRIDTLDVLRGVAICGILLMNIPVMGGIGLAGRPPLPAAWTADWIAWGLQSVLFEGTMRGLFTLLFGAGMLLMLRRADGPDGRVAPIDVWTRRCLILMGFGIVQFAVFLWPGEILWTYGLTGLALLAFRTARIRTLLLVAGILLAGLTGWYMIEDHGHRTALMASRPALAAQARGATPTDAQEAAIEARETLRKDLHPTAVEVREEAARRTGPGVLGWSAGLWAEWNLGAESWPWVAESLCFMLIGMALFRSGTLTGQASAGTYLRMAAIGYGGGIALRLVLLWLYARAGFDVNPDAPDAAAGLFGALIHQPARLLVTLGHVGLVAGLFRAGLLGRATPLRAMGRMALTVYSLESIVTSILFYGFGMVGAFGFAALMGIAALVWIGCALFCLWWLRRHEAGPAEALLRTLAYGTFRRRRAEANATLAAAPPL
jgi:uncharacterized protein